MVIDLICENNSNKLCDPGKNQISMQSPLILGSASCKTEIVFDVVDISFDNSPDFIGIIPFFGAADRSGISTKILFRVDVDHPPTFRRSTRVVTETMNINNDDGIFELIYHKSISFLDRQIYILLLHCEVWKCLRTSFVKKDHGDNTIDGIIQIFKSGSCIQRNISFREMFVITKSVTGKKALIELCGIESSITGKVFGLIKGCLEKKSLSVGIKSFES